MLIFTPVHRLWRWSVCVLACGVPAMAAPDLAAAQRAVIDNDLARCGAQSGPAMLVEVAGFKGGTGTIRVQSYPAERGRWLAKGGWINRIETPVRLNGGRMRFCLPVPDAGRYGIAVRHDRNGNGKTDLWQDGGGFSNNPKLSVFNMGKPAAEKVAVSVGNSPANVAITLQYM